MRKPRTGPCEGCGQPVTRVRPSIRRHLCQECAAEAAMKGAVQMATKSGPAWERWLASNANGAALERAKREREQPQ